MSGPTGRRLVAPAAVALLAGLGSCGRSEPFDCQIDVEPAALDFGTVPVGGSVQRSMAVVSVGNGSCDISGIGLAGGADPGFSLAPGQPAAFSLAPGQGASISVAFETANSVAPFVRHATLGFDSSDPVQPALAIPLVADVPHCNLSVSPSPLDFGNILLNSSATYQVTLANDGGLACDVSAIALASGSDADFSLPPSQPLAFTVAPGGSAAISVTFSDSSGDQPPLLRQGTLDLETGDPVQPTAEVPLEAYVNTVCEEASQWIYTVETNGTFSRFDPASLAFTEIGTLSCADDSSPFSMAVDQNAVAWVVYDSGHLFQVSTSTAACQATSFQPDQEGQLVFGMSFVFQPTTGVDTLFVAGAGAGFGSGQDLATIAFPSLALTTIAPITLGYGELAGTGDGQLWELFPSFGSVSGVSTLAQLDPATAAVVQSFQYPSMTASGDFAVKFWGGSFWIFLGPTLYEVPRATGLATVAIPDMGRQIVGAGVSTCAPVQ